MPHFSDNMAQHPDTAQFYLSHGMAFAARGQVKQAVAAFERAINLKPDFAEAYFNLGIAQITLGRVDAAIKSYHHHLLLNPDHPEAYYNLANAQLNKGDIDAAIQNYRKAIDAKPTYAVAFNNLGMAFTAKGEIEAAMHSFEQAIQLKPDFGRAYVNLAALYLEMNRASDSIACYQKYIRLHPDDAKAYNNLGNSLHEIGKTKQAIPCYQKALALNPQYAEAAYNMANTLQEQDRLEEALEVYQKALELRPDWAELSNNMGTTFQRLGKIGEAADCFKKALKIQPENVEAINNLGVIYRNQGKIKAAIGCYQTALQLDPGYSEAHSNLLFGLNYDETASEQDHFTEACNWWQHHGKVKANSFVHYNSRDPLRRLKIGYVSPDLRRHSVGFFFLPLIAAHHHAEFEIYCYAEVRTPDETTRDIRAHADHWYSTVGQTDTSVAQKIFSDNIDILVDLAGHTAHNRMLVFAQKPAPIQMTWLGYPNTTGLQTIDYRLTDAIADPPEATDHLYSETLIRLPRGFLCYGAPNNAPDVSGLPAGRTGRITFASFNALPKMNAAVIAVWSEILHRVPGSRLLLKCKQLADPITRQIYLDEFTRRGIGADRIMMQARTPSFQKHLDLYNQVDIALDPFPYNGTTTTCEALWMGVPVVSLRGKRHSARVGASILSRIGLTDLVAETEEQYVIKAVQLASNRGKLQKLRSEMRDRIKTSPINDDQSFAGAMENTFRENWQKWCKRSERVSEILP